MTDSVPPTNTDKVSRANSHPSSPVVLADARTTGLFVLNRHGEREQVSFDKILSRLRRLAIGLHDILDPDLIAQKVIEGLYKGITTSDLDALAAETAAYMAATHPDYSKLAARIAIDNLHKNTMSDYLEVCNALVACKDKQGVQCSLMTQDLYDFIKENIDAIHATMMYENDFEYDFFGFKTLERSYLLRVDGVIVERPQHLLMRVSCAIHQGDIEKALETYTYMSKKYFIHATPTLFNAGTLNPQMSSCFLLTMKEDSIGGIFDTLKQCALISKTAGGIGLAVHKIRASSSYIRGTNGYSNGLVPMLRVFNDTARYVDQGGGKRKGSFAIYLEPWHADVEEFLDLKKNHGKEELRARDLFYAMWIPDLFMKRVENDGEWSLFCPNEAPGLHEVHSEEFEELYHRYEREGRAKRVIKAQKLWFAILQSQIETGTPYMLYKDACNRKSNQKNLGTIQSSNLCTEIVEYTSHDEVAVCNLASIALPQFVKKDGVMDYEAIRKVAATLTNNLNKVIDINYYPVQEARNSNMRHRPIGLGVQGLADAFMKMKLVYDSEEAREVNRRVFESIYYGACEASINLAEKDGAYQTYKGSPASMGKFQFDLWNDEYKAKGMAPVKLSGLWDWENLRIRLMEHGMRNSLLVAPMPTASTSQILGNNESFEPYTSNVYYRRVLSGEFFVVNPHLLKDLIARGMWNDSLKNILIASNGSIQNIEGIPQDLKDIYRTVWEIKQKSVLEMARDRGPFIDQSQSLNIHLTDPNFAKMSSMHFAGWKMGLKTGVYYLRTLAAAEPIKFSVDHSVATAAKRNDENSTMQMACPMRKPGDSSDICHACSG